MEKDDIKSIDETSNEERWRMLSILSYLIVLLGFGLPIWWATTRVYRAPLPLDEMLELRPGPLPPLQVFVHATTEEKTRGMVSDMRSILGSAVSLTPQTSPLPLPTSPTSISTPSIAPGCLLLQEWPDSPHELIFSHHRIIYYRSGVPALRLARVLQAWPGLASDTALVGGADAGSGGIESGEPAIGEQFDRAFPAASEYDVLVTVIENDGKRMDWDIVDALEDYISPYLHALSPLANFTVKSQVLHYVGLGVRARAVGAHWALAEALLSHAVTPLETRLAAHVSRRPAVNLVLYVPACDTAPMYIYTRAGVRSSGPIPAFISPRWGGISILNPNCSAPTWAPDTSLVMATLVTQLSKLLGVPPVPAGAHLAAVEGAESGVAAWQLDWMMRARTKEYLDSARLTLRSLAQLLSEISNIVIRDEVADSVHEAVASVAASQYHLEAGHAEEAFHSAQRAAQAAEAAFTDPTLLALLYFPDDQKYAVYIPLFLPIMIPVIMSMRQLIQYVRKPKIVEKCQ